MDDAVSIKRNEYANLTVQNTQLLETWADLTQQYTSRKKETKHDTGTETDCKLSLEKLNKECQQIECVIQSQHEYIMKLRQDILQLKRKDGNITQEFTLQVRRDKSQNHDHDLILYKKL